MLFQLFSATADLDLWTGGKKSFHTFLQQTPEKVLRQLLFSFGERARDPF
jgi:hypothetical protein